MHPILAARRRLLLYLLAWTPVLGLLVDVSRTAGARTLDAAAVLGPAVIVLAFVCLSPWPICRARPLRLPAVPGLVVTFTVAATVGSLAFVGTAALMAFALSRPAVLSGIAAVVFGLGMLLYLLSTGLHYAMIAAEASREAERRAAEARALAREAELQALRIQLNPHFLFNSLHSISALATIDGARAREMCIRLADFLRTSLGLGERETIPIAEELALARSYLEVEQVRFGKRLRVDADIRAECENCGIPALLLQPLIENAVKHGIAGLIEGGAVRLSARRDDSVVTIVIENEFDPDASTGRRDGLGLTNVRKRLDVRYGREATFEAAALGDVYRVVLRLPCESPIASSNRA